jgi:hypothetical protein
VTLTAYTSDGRAKKTALTVVPLLVPIAAVNIGVSAGAWNTVDVSNYVPAGTREILVDCDIGGCTQSGGWITASMSFRKNASSPNAANPAVLGTGLSGFVCHRVRQTCRIPIDEVGNTRSFQYSYSNGFENSPSVVLTLIGYYYPNTAVPGINQPDTFLKHARGAATTIKYGQTDSQAVDYTGGYGGSGGPFNVRIPHGLGMAPIHAWHNMDTCVSTSDSTDICVSSWQNTAWDATYFYIRWRPLTGAGVNYPGAIVYWSALVPA